MANIYKRLIFILFIFIYSSHCETSKKEKNFYQPDIYCNQSTSAKAISKDDYHFYKIHCDTPLFSSEMFNILISIISEGDSDIFVSTKDFFPISSESYNWTAYSPLPIDGISIQLPRKTKSHTLYLTVHGFRESVYIIEVLTSLKLIPFYDISNLPESSIVVVNNLNNNLKSTISYKSGILYYIKQFFWLLFQILELLA